MQYIRPSLLVLRSEWGGRLPFEVAMFVLVLPCKWVQNDKAIFCFGDIIPFQTGREPVIEAPPQRLCWNCTASSHFPPLTIGERKEYLTRVKFKDGT
jgi:hypothetical protein